ncbi:MAG: hypothetical protein JSU77_04995 [Fidelibacterota bacterium]|nr:MAG: hypothetical protein JSU77_04995 [Candidatus Neomarinimicrobiota bacterium]
MDTRPPARDRLLPVLLVGLSFFLLACEVVLLRILTYLQWYHFAYLVISLALLGFGASGTLLHLFRPFWLRHHERIFTLTLLLTGIAMAAVKPLLAAVPTESFLVVWQPGRLWGLVLLCLTLFLPFFCGAFGLIVVFSAAPQRIALHYGANLLGSGAGALGGLLLLYRWHPLDLPPLLGLGTGLLGLLSASSAWLRERRSSAKAVLPVYPGLGLAGLALIALLGWAAPLKPSMSPFKAFSRTRLMPQTEVLLERSSPQGVLAIVRSPTLRSATGLSLSFQGEIYPQAVAFLDGNPLGPLPLLDDTAATSPLHHTSFTIPYHVRSFSSAPDKPLVNRNRKSMRVLVLNAAAGSEVHQALMEGADSVTAVVRNPVMLQAFDDLIEAKIITTTVYRDPRVRAITAEPRSFLYRDTGRFDVVMIPPTGGVVNAAAAMQAIYENNLLTEEGVAAILRRLSPEGLLCITTWLDSPPRRLLKMFGLLVAASESLESEAAVYPGAHLAAIGSWNVATVILSRRPWSPGELDRIHQFAANEGFDLLYLPDGSEDEEAITYHQLADTSLVSDLAILASGITSREVLPSPFHLTPPTDDRPFFHHFLTLRSLSVMRNTLGAAGVMLAEWGYVLLWITLALLLVGGVALILLPLGLSRHSFTQNEHGVRLARRSLSLLYFGAIGGGFMLVEIVLIQKLVLVLGDPVFATAAVIAALLVFAGAGSMLSERLARAPCLLVPCAVALIIILLAGLFGSIVYFASAWASLAQGSRLLVVIAALAPLALVMGMFFPTGVRWLNAAGADHLIPWAWGINGFAAVIATPVATIAALNLGFPAVGALGAVCYLLAAAVSFRWWARRQTNQPVPPASPIPNSHQGK